MNSFIIDLMRLRNYLKGLKGKMRDRLMHNTLRKL